MVWPYVVDGRTLEDDTRHAGPSDRSQVSMTPLTRQRRVVSDARSALGGPGAFGRTPVSGTASRKGIGAASVRAIVIAGATFAVASCSNTSQPVGTVYQLPLLQSSVNSQNGTC